MDYEALAIELLKNRMKFHRVPANGHMSKLLHGEWFVLNYLNTAQDNVHPKDLSRAMGVSSARIARLLKHMEGKRLVTRRADVQDSRQVILSLTEEGVAAIERIRTEAVRQTARLLEQLGPEDAQHYLRIEQKIVQSVSSR